VEHAVPVDLGTQPGEHAAEADGGAVHEHELAGRRDPADAAEFAMHLAGDAGTVDGVAVLLDRLNPVLHQRCIEEPRPVVEDVDQFPAEVLEAPGLVGMDLEFLVVVTKGLVKVDDGADERRLEHPDTPEIQQVD